jgi:hypothetical protein
MFTLPGLRAYVNCLGKSASNHYPAIRNTEQEVLGAIPGRVKADSPPQRIGAHSAKLKNAPPNATTAIPGSNSLLLRK